MQYSPLHPLKDYTTRKVTKHNRNEIIDKNIFNSVKQFQKKCKIYKYESNIKNNE